jgi:hypothetical protein
MAHDDELVTAKARDCVVGSDRVLKALRDLSEYQVAYCVAPVVVQRLEPVEIEKEDCDRARVSLRTRECTLNPIAQQHAIRKISEGVM